MRCVHTFPTGQLIGLNGIRFSEDHRLRKTRSRQHALPQFCGLFSALLRQSMPRIPGDTRLSISPVHLSSESRRRVFAIGAALSIALSILRPGPAVPRTSIPSSTHLLRIFRRLALVLICMCCAAGTRGLWCIDTLASCGSALEFDQTLCPTVHSSLYSRCIHAAFSPVLCSPLWSLATCATSQNANASRQEVYQHRYHLVLST